jgi:hypothetical protein
MRNRVAHMRRPSALFGLFFDAEVLDMILQHTNAYGSSKYSDWVPLDRDGLRAVIGTMILMAIMRLCDIKNYWNDQFGIEQIKRVWPRNTFLRYYHCIRICSAPKPPSAAAKDRLWIVEELCRLLNTKYAAARDPPQVNVVDETMIASRHDHPSFQKMPEKPIDKGFKVNTHSDVFGYVYHQLLYVGKDPEVKKPAPPHFETVVLKLMAPYLHQNRIVVMNSAYTSLQLFLKLLAAGTMAVGKLHSNRRFPPHARNAELKDDQWVTVQCKATPAISATAHNAHKFKSLLLSTATPLPMQIAAPNPKAKHQHPQPEVIAFYNRYYGGVDSANRWATHPWLHRKHYTWWFTFFEHFINVAIGNSWVLYCHVLREQHTDLPEMGIEQFAGELAMELIGTFCARIRSVRRPILHAAAALHRHESPLTVAGVRQHKRDCTICTRGTVWYCTCGKAVCHTDRNCFEEHLKRSAAAGSD